MEKNREQALQEEIEEAIHRMDMATLERLRMFIDEILLEQNLS